MVSVSGGGGGGVMGGVGLHKYGVIIMSGEDTICGSKFGVSKYAGLNCMCIFY